MNTEESFEYYNNSINIKSNIINDVFRIFCAIIFVIIGTGILWITAPLGLLHPLMRKRGYNDGELPLDIIQGFWSKGLLYTLGIKVIVKNSHNVPKDGSVIVPNHVSALDFVIMSATGVNARFIMKYELLYLVPYFFLIAWIYGHVPINRKNREESIRSINKLGKESSKIKRNIVIFPEGTRTRNNKLQEFKKGPFHLAIKTKMSIVPALISGAIDIWPYDKWIPASGTVKVEYLEELKTEGLNSEELLIKTRRIMNDYIGKEKFEGV